jgi:UDP-N-acetylmuramyl pentapeptide phosphotransferase/UDP-N-acetylglucosamine-1-phosphate transferase
MLDVLLTGSVSFIITFLAIPIVLQIAEEKKLFDVPDERKIHKVPVPSLGGVGIFGGFLLASLLSISSRQNSEFQYFFAAAVIIFLLGLKDDLVVLSASKKFVGQMVAASILIHLGGIRITSMHGLFGFTELSEGVSIALSYLTIIVVINSFNLIDGVDGLAGSLGLVTMLLFGIYFFGIQMPAYSLLAFAMAGSLLAFLIFNHHPAKIFMGDSGSLMLGLVNSILVIKFITIADSHAIAIPIESSVVVGIAILIVPLVDTLRVFSIRIFRGSSPFTPDRNHVHHLLLERGFKHPGITFFCVVLNLLFIAVAYFGRSLGPTYLLLVILGMSFSGLALLFYYKRPKPHMFVAKHLDEEEEFHKTIAPKVVTITKEAAVAEQQ